MAKPYLIVITGFPGTGKTRLGRELSSRFHIPLISKDAFKERMFDTLGYSDKAWSLKVSAAAHRIIDYLLSEELRSGNSLILESNFKPGIDDERFRKLRQKYDFSFIQVLCWAQGDELFRRFMQRQSSIERHPGHVEDATPEQTRRDLAVGKSDVLSIADETLEIDTTNFESVDYEHIARRIGQRLNAN